jgi:Rrf2 family protein
LLVVALQQDQGPVSLRQIAASEGISEQYLEQLFVELRRAKLVSGVRGASGGYLLARAPEEITIGDILRVVEGPIAPVECVREGGSDCCGRASECVTRELWVELRDSMTKLLDSRTLAHLVAKARGRSDMVKKVGAR